MHAECSSIYYRSLQKAIPRVAKLPCKEDTEGRYTQKFQNRSKSHNFFKNFVFKPLCGFKTESNKKEMLPVRPEFDQFCLS